MVAFFILLVYAAACLGAGLLGLRALSRAAWPALAKSDTPLIATGFVLGQALLAALWIFVALGGFLTPLAVIAVCIVLTVASLPLLPAVVRPRWTRALEHAVWLSRAHPGISLAAAALVLLIIGFGMAAWLKPPFGDAEAFYLVYARLIAVTQRLEPMPGLYEAFSTVGLVGEMHLAALIAAAGVPAAKVFAWMLGIALAALLVAIAGEAGVDRLGRIAVLALLFTTTAFTYHLFDGKVDLFAAALGLAAVWWLLAIPRKAPVATAVAVAGLSTGFAAVAKFSYVLGFVPVVLVLLLWQRIEASAADRPRGSITAIVLAITAFSAWSALATVPHIVKNAVLFAAPLAPFIGGPADKSWLHQVWFTEDVTTRIVLTYPFTLVFGRYPMQGGNLSYLWLALLPLAWWLPRPSRWSSSTMLKLCAAGAVGTALWVALRPSVIAPRYLLATLLLFYPLTAKAMERVLVRETPPRWFGAGVLAVVLSAFVIFSYPLLPIARHAVAVMRYDVDPCALASPYCAPLRWLSAAAAPGDRVYFAGYYGYWLRDDLLQCRDQNAESRLPRSLGGPGLTWDALVAGGFRWLAVEKASHEQLWAELAKHPRPAELGVEIFWDDPTVLIVHVADKRSAHRVACKQVAPGTWAPKRP